MAMYSFRDCLASEIQAQEVVNGSFLVCRDTGDMYYDNLEGDRITISKTVHCVEGKLGSYIYPEEGHMYYSATDKIIAIYHNEEMVPINVNTLQYMRSGVTVGANGSVKLVLSTDDKFKGMADDTGTAKVIGTILAIYPVGYNISNSIADLESDFDGKITITSEVDATNGSSITVANTADKQWIGNVSCMILLVPAYAIL